MGTSGYGQAVCFRVTISFGASWISPGHQSQWGSMVAAGFYDAGGAVVVVHLAGLAKRAGRANKQAPGFYVAKFCTNAFRGDAPFLEVVDRIYLGTTADGYLSTGGLAGLGAQPIAGRMVDTEAKKTIIYFFRAESPPLFLKVEL